MKNITLSIDEKVLQAGREYARQHNVSFNGLVRRLIEQTVVQKQAKWLDDAFLLMDKANVSSSGNRCRRDDLYRVKRDQARGILKELVEAHETVISTQALKT